MAVKNVWSTVLLTGLVLSAFTEDAKANNITTTAILNSTTTVPEMNITTPASTNMTTKASTPSNFTTMVIVNVTTTVPEMNITTPASTNMTTKASTPSNFTTMVIVNVTTTVPESNITTPADTNITTSETTPTTTKTLPTPKPVGPPKYIVRDGRNKACLMLQADIKTSMQYYDVFGGGDVTVKSTVPRDATLNGLCSDKSDQIYLSWRDGLVAFGLQLKFNKTGSNFHLADAMLSYAAGSSTHSSSGSYSATVDDDKVRTALGTSYNCSTGINITVAKAETFVMNNLQVGAFMDDDSQDPSFMKTGTDCLNSGLSPGAIAGIVIGALVFVAIVVTIVVVICRSRSRNRRKYRHLVN